MGVVVLGAVLAAAVASVTRSVRTSTGTATGTATGTGTGTGRAVKAACAAAVVAGVVWYWRHASRGKASDEESRVDDDGVDDGGADDDTCSGATSATTEDRRKLATMVPRNLEEMDSLEPHLLRQLVKRVRTLTFQDPAAPKESFDGDSLVGIDTGGGFVCDTAIATLEGARYFIKFADRPDAMGDALFGTMGFHMRECVFYQAVAQRLSRFMKVPRCVACGYLTGSRLDVDEPVMSSLKWFGRESLGEVVLPPESLGPHDQGRGFLALEEIPDANFPNMFPKGFTVEQVAQVLKQVAVLHAFTSAETREASAMRHCMRATGSISFDAVGSMFQEGLDALTECMSEVFEVDPKIAQGLREALESTGTATTSTASTASTEAGIASMLKVLTEEKWVSAFTAHRSSASVSIDEAGRTVAVGVQSITHGDLWCGQTLWNDGGLAGLIDWQCACLNNPASDVAFLILSSLDAAQRRTHLNHLLEVYARAVTEAARRFDPTAPYPRIPHTLEAVKKAYHAALPLALIQFIACPAWWTDEYTVSAIPKVVDRVRCAIEDVVPEVITAMK